MKETDPVSTGTVRQTDRPSGTTPRIAVALILVAIFVLAAGALFATRMEQPHPPTFGAAANGTIAFVDGQSLKSADADGTHIRSLVTLPDGADGLTFSPDGARLAYRTTGTIPSIIVAAADGSNPLVVVSSVRLPTQVPLAWSPDSRRLAFTWGLVADKIGTIDVVDADGSNQRQVIEGAPADGVDRWAPAWSPDGQWISFFAADANGQVELHVIHPDGSGERALKTSPMNPDLGRMAWSPDPAQSRLAYVAGANVDLYDLATETETTVATGFWPTWSADGRRVTSWSEGTHVALIADILAGRRLSSMAFPAVRGSCGDDPELAGKAICGPALWSPDSAWLYGFDVVGMSIVFGRADGSSSARSIKLDHPVDLSELGDAGLVAWQPIVP